MPLVHNSRKLLSELASDIAASLRFWPTCGEGVDRNVHFPLDELLLFSCAPRAHYLDTSCLYIYVAVYYGAVHLL